VIAGVTLLGAKHLCCTNQPCQRKSSQDLF